MHWHRIIMTVVLFVLMLVFINPAEPGHYLNYPLFLGEYSWFQLVVLVVLELVLAYLFAYLVTRFGTDRKRR